MNLTRWNPMRDLEDMSERLNRMFARERRPDSCRLGVDGRYRGRQQAYHISAELPGLTKDDVKITLQEGVLTIHGERQ